MRKAFSFYKSYWDSYIELETDREKVEFFESLCEVQFLERHIDDIKPASRFVRLLFISIKHSLNSSIRGYCSKVGIVYDSAEFKHPYQGGCQGGCLQVEEEGEEQVEEKGKGQVKEEQQEQINKLNLAIESLTNEQALKKEENNVMNKKLKELEKENKKLKALVNPPESKPRTQSSIDKEKEQKIAFESLWVKYPGIKEAKDKCLAKFKKDIKSENDYQELCTALNNYTNFVKVNKTERQYIKRSKTFFNNWKDWVDVEVETNKGDDKYERFINSL